MGTRQVLPNTLSHNIRSGLNKRKYIIPVENYDMFCRRIKKTTVITIDKEENQIMIGETRKTLGQKNAKGESKQAHCWTGTRLTPEYQRELLEAKAKADKDAVDG